MQAYNTSNLVTPENLKWKVLIIGDSGTGKTSWLSTAPDIGIAACETGHGSGMLSIAHSSVDFVEPKTFLDLRSVCLDTFEPFQKKGTIGLDSLTAMTKSLVKDHVLSAFPTKNPKEAMRRQAGVPSGLDFSDMADLTRVLLTYLLRQNKHVIATALAKYAKDDNGAIIGVGPDLPGALGTGAVAAFDSVLYLKVRKIYKDPKDAKSAFYERYFVTGNDGFHAGKDRNSDKFKSFLSPEEVFDPSRNLGTFPALFAKILAGHTAATASAVPPAAIATPSSISI
jgi:hypothetical protein